MGAFLLLNKDLDFRRGFAAGAVVACIDEAVANRRINRFMIAECAFKDTEKVCSSHALSRLESANKVWYTRVQETGSVVS